MPLLISQMSRDVPFDQTQRARELRDGGMRRSKIRALSVAMAVVTLGASASCDRNSDAITATSPFLSVVVTTPADGGSGIRRRAENFASHHRMRMVYSDEHLSSGEYSVRLLRPDFNIASDNVLQDGKSLVMLMFVGSRPRSSAKKRPHICAKS
jgi:hypothetical protein